MASLSVDRAPAVRAGALFTAALAEHGSGAHPYAAGGALLAGPEALRNLADAVHFLGTLHGRHPGVIEQAAERGGPGAAWLTEAAAAFAAERLYLTRLAAAAGPVPGTPGGAASEALALAQRHAIETLATSERGGCALGAALALAADWTAIRTLLDRAAGRLGVEPPPSGLAPPEALAACADRAATGAPVERAMLFGAQQMLLQHRGLWDLLEARAAARAAC